MGDGAWYQSLHLRKLSIVREIQHVGSNIVAQIVHALGALRVSDSFYDNWNAHQNKNNQNSDDSENFDQRKCSGARRKVPDEAEISAPSK